MAAGGGVCYVHPGGSHVVGWLPLPSSPTLPTPIIASIESAGGWEMYLFNPCWCGFGFGKCMLSQKLKQGAAFLASIIQGREAAWRGEGSGPLPPQRWSLESE